MAHHSPTNGFALLYATLQLSRQDIGHGFVSRDQATALLRHRHHAARPQWQPVATQTGIGGFALLLPVNLCER